MYSSPTVLIFSRPRSSTKPSKVVNTSFSNPTSSGGDIVGRHRREVDHIGEQHRGRLVIVRDHRGVRLEPPGDLVGQDVVQQIIGLCLQSVTLAHEVRHGGEHEDHHPNDRIRDTGGRPLDHVHRFDPFRQHHGQGEGEDVGQEPSERGPDAENDQRAEDRQQPKQDHDFRGHQSAEDDCCCQYFHEYEEQGCVDDPIEPMRFESQQAE